MNIKNIVIDILLGLGFIFMISPITLYWFIHGNNKRYIWIINGPYPFSNFGSGPFQMVIYIALLFAGLILIVISCILKRTAK